MNINITMIGGVTVACQIDQEAYEELKKRHLVLRNERGTNEVVLVEKNIQKIEKR